MLFAFVVSSSMFFEDLELKEVASKFLWPKGQSVSNLTQKLPATSYFNCYHFLALWCIIIPLLAFFFLIVCEIPRSFERSSLSSFRTQGSFIHINSGKIFERDLVSSDSVATSATQKPWVFWDCLGSFQADHEIITRLKNSARVLEIQSC